jgi:hypothetical protein
MAPWWCRLVWREVGPWLLRIPPEELYARLRRVQPELERLAESIETRSQTLEKQFTPRLETVLKKAFGAGVSSARRARR